VGIEVSVDPDDQVHVIHHGHAFLRSFAMLGTAPASRENPTAIL
jgi:hypothetical protein